MTQPRPSCACALISIAQYYAPQLTDACSPPLSPQIAGSLAAPPPCQPNTCCPQPANPRVGADRGSWHDLASRGIAGSVIPRKRLLSRGVSMATSTCRGCHARWLSSRWLSAASHQIHFQGSDTPTNAQPTTVASYLVRCIDQLDNTWDHSHQDQFSGPAA